MKKLFVMFLAALTLFSLSACGGEVSGNYGYPYKEDAEQGQETQETQEDSDPTEVKTKEDLLLTIDNVEEWMEGNSVSVKVNLRPEWVGKIDFAYYLIRGKVTEVKQMYIDDNQFTFSDLEPGAYRIKYFLRYGNLKAVGTTSIMTVEAEIIESAGEENVESANADGELAET